MKLTATFGGATQVKSRLPADFMWRGTLGGGVVQRSFSVEGLNFNNPQVHHFTLASATQAIKKIPHGQARQDTGLGAESGVTVGDVASYKYIQYLEEKGDRLTGDHQPSGAAIKEAIRVMLHTSLLNPLTRGMARNAYQKALTIVMTDAWHKADSRTYGGRNSPAQIMKDAADLVTASIEDWKKSVSGLREEKFSNEEIQDLWNALCTAREAFFATGNAQKGTF